MATDYSRGDSYLIHTYAQKEGVMVKYNLVLTEDDKTALINIINLTTFKGSDSEYVSDLKDRVSKAPICEPEGQANEGRPTK